MQYKNGKEVFPPSLLNELQQYIQGELIYIPKKKQHRAGWGEMNGTRQYMTRRNQEIYELYREGCSFEKLEQKFSLSKDTIRKIIYKTRGEYNQIKS
ncbi:CD3324 family protein [Bacillus horti]|uniref:Mor family transcriptional regulator n=1 Tax=Caldalkalibacillus horti TaxID=77523 RepID=A0ABT9VYA6_9BACI|nr:CD3324 family protein [Bacillus horti]MDQ0165982.1 Mor family transcriptional regulator [Bacillus horti]